MTSRRPGRRVPSKSHGLRAPGARPPADPSLEPDGTSAGVEGGSGSSGGTGSSSDAFPGAPPAGGGVRPGSRAANRAAKRAAAGPVRAKASSRSGRARSSSRGSSTGLIVLGAIAVVIVAVAVVVLGNPFGTPAASPSPEAPVVYGDGTCPTSQPASLTADEAYDVTIKTELGDIVMRIDGSLAPIATGNFIALVQCHYYDGVVFHRLVPGFVIQGGDPDGTGSGPGPGYRITDDPLTTTYHRGTIAMARTPAANSQGSQFFIVLSDDANAALTDPSVVYPYAILGEVTSGMDVVDQIAAMPNSGSPSNAAINPVVMQSVTAVVAPAASPTPSAAPTDAPSTDAPSTEPTATAPAAS